MFLHFCRRGYDCLTGLERRFYFDSDFGSF